ncbi:MAG TPA: hypothetical protein VFF87_12360 [Hyphomicrobium sp.]|nr:hypothetical protein [Hyphomicrobium sp.]
MRLQPFDETDDRRFELMWSEAIVVQNPRADTICDRTCTRKGPDFAFFARRIHAASHTACAQALAGPPCLHALMDDRRADTYSFCT